MITNTSFFCRRRHFASMAICSQFAVLSIQPSHSCHYYMWLRAPAYHLRSNLYVVCLFSSEKIKSKNINYCYGPLRWSQYITAGDPFDDHRHTHTHTKICSNILYVYIDTSNKYYILKLKKKKTKKKNIGKKKTWKSYNSKCYWDQYYAKLSYMRAMANCPRTIQTKFPERKVKEDTLNEKTRRRRREKNTEYVHCAMCIR